MKQKHKAQTSSPPFEFLCEGPREFGPDINKVCCHGWNCDHFLGAEEADRTQQLINCGVIVTEQGQHVLRRNSDGTFE